MALLITLAADQPDWVTVLGAPTRRVYCNVQTAYFDRSRDYMVIRTGLFLHDDNQKEPVGCPRALELPDDVDTPALWARYTTEPVLPYAYELLKQYLQDLLGARAVVVDDLAPAPPVPA